MTVTLYLMTMKGYHALKAMVEHHHADIIDLVVVGRDEHLDNDHAGELIQLCKEHSIQWCEQHEQISIVSDYSIAVSWRRLITTNSKLIVLHDSLLPKYRGFAPLVNALINREAQTGVSAIYANENYDSGEIILQSVLELKYPLKIAEAIQLICRLYSEIIIKLSECIARGEQLISHPQNHDEATYCLWLNEDDYFIDWSKPAGDILQFIYSVSSPFKGASTRINGNQLIRIMDGEIVDDAIIENRVPGKIIFTDGIFPIVVCGTGLLKITLAHFDDSKENALPFNHFRTRLSGTN